MGFKQKSQVNYVKMKEGKFYASNDKELTTPYDELEGMVTGINTRTTEFEGKKMEKLQITMNDGQDTYVFETGFDTSYTSSLIGFLKNADLTQPLSLVPTIKTEGTGATAVTKKGILVKQNGKWLKAYYTKDNPNGQPKIEPVMNKGKQVVQNGRPLWDKEEFLEFFRGVVKNELAPQLGDGGGTHGYTENTERREETYVNTSEPDDINDDLPF